MNKKLFVGSLPADTNSKEIRALFGKAGKVTAVEIAVHRYTQKPSGFGYVTLSTEKDAKKAIKMYHGFKLRDGKLTVYEAKVERESFA